MEQIVTALEMKKIDQYTIENIGISALVLMENAARSVVEEISLNYPKYRKVLVVYGNGNNGADAVCVARILSNLIDENGMHLYDVDLFEVSNSENKSKECTIQLEIARKFITSETTKYELDKYDLIIDGMFGVGLNREIENPYKSCIEDINSSNTFVLSLDIPSGIDGTNGFVLGSAIKADKTIAFGFKKTGHLLGDGPNYTGELVCRDIGLYQGKETDKYHSINSFKPTRKPIIAKRVVTGNKGTFGKILLLTGCDKYAGASVLSTLAAYRTGAGMVQVITHKNNKSDILKQCPGAIISEYDDLFCKEDVIKAFEWCDVLAMGPGMGNSTLVTEIFDVLINCCENYPSKPVVFDADAINLIAKKKAYLRSIVSLKTVVFTPHMKELSRLLDKEITEIKEELITIAGDFAEKWKCILVCKDAKTLVSDGGINHTYINQSGNQGMATAGSGDVLTGMVASMLCQEEDSFYAVISAVQMHGLAGDIAYKKYKRGLIASDIIETIHEVI